MIEDRLHEASRPELYEKIERLNFALDRASSEIARLNRIIDGHVKSSSSLVRANYITSSESEISDIGSMRTTVHSRPIHLSFYLMEPLGGWSEDHREAFKNQVVKVVSESIADEITRSIWDA